MTDIEIEEGEAYFFQDDDDNENIDPDRDFSYIDKKIENVLGHYQKDFMGGLSTESLGARYGGYGSFLPMQQRSPPILSNQRSQNHVNLKSSPDLPSERFHQNPAIPVNHSVPARPIPASGDQNVEALSESGTSSMNNQSKIQSSGDFASNHQKKKVMVHPEKSTLKFRVKMASENISQLDKSALYSGLGLDMSPTSSPEGSPSRNDGTSNGLPGTKLESPSSIVKVSLIALLCCPVNYWIKYYSVRVKAVSFIWQIMTTIPVSSDDLLSPLHDSLVYLRGIENTSGAGLPGVDEAYTVNAVPESGYMKGKKEGRKERKSKVKDASKVKKSKHKEASEERLSKQNAQSQRMEKCEYPANIVALSDTRKEEDGASITKEAVSNASINAVAYTEEKECASLVSKNTGSNPYTVFDKRNEAGCFGEETDNPMKQVHIAKHKAKEEPSSAKKHDVVENDMNAKSLRGKVKKDKSFNFIPRSESSTEKRDVMGGTEGVVSKSSKQLSISKDKVKEEVLDSAHPKDRNTTLVPKSEYVTDKRNAGQKENESNKFFRHKNTEKDKVKEEILNSPSTIGDALYRKDNGIVEKNMKDEEVCFLPQKTEENDWYNDVSQDVKFDNAQLLEPSKQKSHSRDMTQSLAEQALCDEKENLSSSVVKKNLKGNNGGVSVVEPPRGSFFDSSSAPQKKGIISKGNFPSRSKKGDSDLRKKTRKNIEVAGKGSSWKKGKEVRSDDYVMGVSESEAPGFTTKLKGKFRTNKPGLASNIGSNMEGDLAGVNCTTDKAGDLPPVENAPVLTENWVECEDCHKWRLLPLGTSADPLTKKKWTCSMITWLPGMNKCSFSEDETSDALRALYVPLDPAMGHSNQPACLDANTSANVSSDVLNVFPPNQATGFDALPSGGKRKSLVKTELHASQQSGFQDLHIPIKKGQQHFSEMKNSKNLKKLPREWGFGRKSGDGKPSKMGRKRVADAEPCVVPKKMKMGHQQPVEDYASAPLRVPQDVAKVSSQYPIVKAKDRSQSYMTSMGEEKYDMSHKKRKLKDKQHPVAATSGKGGHLVKNCDAGETGLRKEKKSRMMNFEASETSADKRRQRIQSDDPVSNLGDVRDSSLHQGGRSDDMPPEQYRGDRVSRKTPGGRTSSEMALDLGLSDSAATSSSSKVSCKVKPKVQGVKSSSVASNSFSPLKVLKSDPDKGTNKKIASHYEQQLKSGAESAPNEFAPHNESFRDRKSNLSRNANVSEAADEDHFGKKVPSGRHLSSRAVDAQPKLEDYKSTDGKMDPTYEGPSTSQQNLATEFQMTKSPFKLPFDGTNSDKGKSRLSKIDSEKEVSSNSHGVPDVEGGSGPIAGRVNNVNGKPSRQAATEHVSSRQWHNTGYASNDIEASSSRKKDNIHGAAKTALREAKDLKHSANRLKVAGSGLESTGIFFQAALKFLHGASLLEPGNNESRSGEMTPNEVYASTAKLCEYCALEYERCNDMASAALAYKCMEVAYMRVVYCNDLAASRDRQELQMAVRAAPQVDSPSSSASDIDNLNQAAIDTVKDGHSAMDHRSHIVSAGNRPNFMRLLDFTHDINLAMEASRRSQGAFAAAMPVFTEAGNEEGISSVKSVLDFSFHDVDGLLHLVRLAMESIKL
ncbi:B3 domain-containing transcription repressor VAL1 [Bienertia sinuspersici]